MRRYQIALSIAVIAILFLSGAVGYLWLHPRSAPQPVVPALSLASQPAPVQIPESTEPKLLPVQLSPQRMQSIGVKTGVVEYKTLHDALRTTGTVEVDETRVASVQVRFSGWIQHVFADATYKTVEKGQRLLTIYSPEIAATEQEYQLARENRTLLGQSTVPGVAAGSSSLLTAATERLKQWQIPDRDITQLEAGRDVPKETDIDSPVAGVITERNAFATNYVQPGTKLYSIADLSTVWVYAQVLQDDIGRIKVGNTTTITTDAWPGRNFTGTVNFVQPQVDDATHTVKVRLEIPNPKMQLSLGMFVNLQIDTPLGRQLTIPASGIFHSGTRQIAFVDHGSGYFEPREVQTGTQAGDDLIVLGGLKAGEHVVTSANFLIDSESQIQAAMGSFAPPPPGAGAAAAMNAPAAQVVIDYSSTPSTPKAGSNLFHVRLTGTDGKPITGASVTVTYFMAAMPAMGMAAMRTVATLSDEGSGNYEGTGQVQMAGTWQVTVFATKDGQTLAQKQIDVMAEGSK